MPVKVSHFAPKYNSIKQMLSFFQLRGAYPRTYRGPKHNT